ncbi:MAG: GTPase [Candidatus Zixiibacteriota bacterium]
MPANLPPQYYDLEREFRAEKDLREKLRMAQELLRMMPKHKGTDKLQAEMKSKIAKLKKQISGGDTKHGARQSVSHDHIEREGAAQVVLIGPPNSGKSSLIDALTHARPLIADYPYTTREPMAGMMLFETVQIELIDTPPISPESFEGYLASLVRNADLTVVVCDLAVDTVVADVQLSFQKLEEKRVLLRPDLSEQPDDPRYCARPTLLCAHKEYDDESGQRQKQLAAAFPDYSIVATSILDDDSMNQFKRAVFLALKIIRVYTKPVGKETDFTNPVILPIGGTVEQAAVELHKDFASKLKFAKLWGQGKFDGQRVNRDFVLSDGDIVEFHI